MTSGLQILEGFLTHSKSRAYSHNNSHTKLLFRRGLMPRDKQDALKHEREIRGVVEQSHISKKNVARLRALAPSRNTQIANLAALVLEVGMVTRYRRRRIRTLARQHPEVLARMEQAGLFPLPVRGEADPHDIDPIAAWCEWVALPENHRGQ